MFETKGIRSSATETYTIEELRVGLVAGSSLDTTASTALELPQPMAGAGGDTRSVHIRDTRAGHLWLVTTSSSSRVHLAIHGMAPTSLLGTRRVAQENLSCTRHSWKE